jgi:hypothetical protein
MRNTRPTAGADVREHCIELMPKKLPSPLDRSLLGREQDGGILLDRPSGERILAESRGWPKRSAWEHSAWLVAFFRLLDASDQAFQSAGLKLTPKEAEKSGRTRC